MDQADLGATSPTTNGGLPDTDAMPARWGRSMAVAALIPKVSFCDECVAKRVGLPARRVRRVVNQIAETLIVTTQAGRCDGCLRQTVVHRLD